MLTKYFTQGISHKVSIHRNIAMYSRRTCFLLYWSSLSGFDEMFEAVCKTGTSPAKKSEFERKRLPSIYAPMLCILSSVSLAGKVKM